MKKYIISLLFASALFATGCNDYLDQDPEELNSLDKIFVSDIETRKWHARMFSDDFMVQEMHYSGQIPYFWCTDESAYVQESFVRSISEGLMSPDNNYGYTGYNLYFFVRYYQAIRHCNIFLERLDECVAIGELDRRQMRAEARFMRAYYHWLLLRLYGPIPIAENSRSSSEIAAKSSRVPFDDCVEWIAREFQWAIDNGLPESRTDRMLGLPTVAAARAIESRMYLMQASPIVNGNTAYSGWKNTDGTQLVSQSYDRELWKKAADAAKAVIEMPEFALLEPAAGATFDEVVDNFRKVTTTWNSEMIWGHTNSLQWYAMCALPARWYGWNGRYSLAAGMINDFFMADGSVARPLEEWFIDKKFSTEDGDGITSSSCEIANTFWMFCGREPRFYASVHYPNMKVSYANPDETDSVNPSGYGICDFWITGMCGTSTGDTNTSGFSVRKNVSVDYWSNKGNGNAWRMRNVAFPIIRLGEIYLNYAEALNEYAGQAEHPTVLKYLNRIRTRAGLPAYEGTYSQEQMREMIRHERKIELAWECNRYFDVRRWFTAHGPQGEFNHNEMGMDMSKGQNATDEEFFTLTQVAVKRFDIEHYWLPIRSSEVTLNNKLVQAPFY